MCANVNLVLTFEYMNQLLSFFQRPKQEVTQELSKENESTEKPFLKCYEFPNTEIHFLDSFEKNNANALLITVLN